MTERPSKIRRILVDEEEEKPVTVPLESSVVVRKAGYYTDARKYAEMRADDLSGYRAGKYSIIAEVGDVQILRYGDIFVARQKCSNIVISKSIKFYIISEGVCLDFLVLLHIITIFCRLLFYSTTISYPNGAPAQSMVLMQPHHAAVVMERKSSKPL
jgi:hypothetical protein